jgi:hypothetical protein
MMDGLDRRTRDDSRTPTVESMLSVDHRLNRPDVSLFGDRFSIRLVRPIQVVRATPWRVLYCIFVVVVTLVE